MYRLSIVISALLFSLNYASAESFATVAELESFVNCIIESGAKYNFTVGIEGILMLQPAISRVVTEEEHNGVIVDCYINSTSRINYELFSNEEQQENLMGSQTLNTQAVLDSNEILIYDTFMGNSRRYNMRDHEFVNVMGIDKKDCGLYYGLYMSQNNDCSSTDFNYYYTTS
ncbi:uncharacterized protein RJT21DRAFT_8356 [Scheffersomyces amazonensis]|uniref:uncharacterized protein n=1 Tax=Scheffersomyces amazonensis TaxID=1078765 RepID=UPI00315D76AC